MLEKTEEENARNEALNMIFTCKTAKTFFFSRNVSNSMQGRK